MILSFQEESSTFRVASYNVLLENRLEQDLPAYTSPQLEFALPITLPSLSKSWSHRWNLIVNEISALDADILGLQGITDSALMDWFEPLLESSK